MHGVSSVSVTPDGKRAVSKSWDKLCVWDLESGKCVSTLEGHNERVYIVDVTPDGKQAVSKSWDNTLRVWNLENGKCLGLFVSASPIREVMVYPDLVLAGTQTGEMLFLELKNLLFDKPVITSTRLWLFDLHSWDTNLTARCPWCCNSIIPDKNTFDKITMFASQVPSMKNPCPDLQSAAWADPLLISECPHCQKPLQYNPFIIDNCSKN
jgi:WD40 repeat protein